MVWLTGGVLLVMLSSPAVAAGGWEDMPFSVLIYIWLVIGLVVGLPTVGLGFFLQAFLRLRTALLLFAVTLILVLWYLISQGTERALESFLTSFIAILLMFSPLFCLGWYIGFRVEKRKTTARLVA